MMKDKFIKNAKKYYKAESYELAKKELNQLLSIDKENYQGNYYYGSILLKEGDFDNAATYFEKCTKSDNSKIDAYLKLSLVYQEKGDMAKAEEYLNIVEKKSPNSDDFLNFKAKFLFKKKEFDEALKKYQRLISGNLPESTKIQFKAAITQCLFCLNRPKDALRVINEILEVNPSEKAGLELELKHLLITKCYDEIPSKLEIYKKIENPNTDFILSIEISNYYFQRKYSDVIEKSKELVNTFLK